MCLTEKCQMVERGEKEKLHFFAYFLICIFIRIHEIIEIRHGKDQLSHPVIPPLTVQNNSLYFQVLKMKHLHTDDKIHFNEPGSFPVQIEQNISDEGSSLSQWKTSKRNMHCI